MSISNELSITITGDKLFIGIILVSVITSTSCFKPGNRNPKQKLLLIDTDAGADDAVGILMAVGVEKIRTDLKIIGITCVNGNADVDVVALNVLKTLKIGNRLDIPVYKGAAHPLVLPNKKDYFFGKDGFGDFFYPNPPSENLIKKEHAVNAMIEFVKEYPGRITLVTLGPLTNIALAIRLYPPFLDNLAELIIMGGSTNGLGNVSPGIEFNFSIDPAATYIVFNSSRSKMATLVPYETIMKANMTIEFRRSWSQSYNSKIWLIDRAESVSLKGNTTEWNCADAVAMSVALTSGSITTKSGSFYSEIIYDGMKTAGLIIVDYTNITGNAANTNLIQSIDKKVYGDLIWRTFAS